MGQNKHAIAHYCLIDWLLRKNKFLKTSFIAEYCKKKTVILSSSEPSTQMNQLYLARYHTQPFPETSAEEFRLSDIRALMYSDYPNNYWETYLHILIGIFIVSSIVFILYKTYYKVAYLINENMDYMYALLIMVILEVYILAFTMIECMSKDNIFTFGADNIDIILLMPLLFIFVIPMMRSIRERKKRP